MEYKKVRTGFFLSRPNRFIACVELEGREERVHVKNTGRCRELLADRAKVYLEEADGPGRKTAYDLIGVEKGSRIVNMDSVAPNKAAGEWLADGGLFPNVTYIRPETAYGSSRFDFYMETSGDKSGKEDPKRILMEVKGVTLEREGVAMFPDAPSGRAVKHVRELIQARGSGYETYILFVIQMTGVSYFTPNRETHPEFCRALAEAKKSGVHILARDCNVWERGMTIRNEVEVVLG